MIAALALAASVLAPAGTAGIQGYPVCLPATAQPGHSYPLSVYVSGGPMALAVNPAHGALERRLHQVPASWVSFGSAGPGTVPVTLSIPPDAAPGAYWSDVEATAQGQGASGAQVTSHAAATAALVFTVGPSKTPPPPCAALDAAYSTGRFPAWPSAAFATSGWKQVIAEDQKDEPKPYTSPTAGTGDPQPAAAPAYSPAASTSTGKTDLRGWAVLGVLALLVIVAIKLKRRKK